MRIFKTYADDLGHLSGQKVKKITRVFRKPDENHDQESLPMFMILLDNGVEVEAFPDELIKQ